MLPALDPPPDYPRAALVYLPISYSYSQPCLSKPAKFLLAK